MTEKGRQPLRLRLLEDLPRCALLDDHAFVHEDDAMPDAPGTGGTKEDFNCG